MIEISDIEAEKYKDLYIKAKEIKIGEGKNLQDDYQLLELLAKIDILKKLFELSKGVTKTFDSSSKQSGS